MKGRLIFFVLFCSWHATQSQCPSVSFSMPSSACLSGNVNLANTSGAGTYEWDFCSGDLNNPPTAQKAYILPAALGRPSIEFAKDQNKWYGFVTGTWSNTLYRLEFGNGIHAAPTLVQNLGSVGGALNQPGAVRILNEAGNWYGLVHNTADGTLVKLSFGNALSNPVTTSILISGVGSTNTGMALGRDPIHGWICLLSTPSNQFQILRLGSGLTAPGAPDILITPSVPNPNNLGDVDLVMQCDQWFAFSSNLGNGNVYRLAFGTNLFQQPVIDQPVDLGGINGGRLRILQEGTDYFLAVTSLSGSLYKINFGNNLNAPSPAVANEGDFGGVLQNSYGLGVAKENSAWQISVIDLGTGTVSDVEYPDVCVVNVVDPNPASPVINFATAGIFNVCLTVINGSGISATLTKTITISASAAPDIDFTSQNNCAGNAINFTEINVSGNIVSRSWVFGDGNSSTSLNPTNTYAAAGIYQSVLTVTAGNGCQNFRSKGVTVYNAPVAAFSLPTASLVCTNQVYLLANTSSFDPSSNPSWEWRLNGILISTQMDLTTDFASPVSQDVQLKAFIPGCSSLLTRTITTVMTGPVVDFSVNDDCQGNSILFSNGTTGADAGYLWGFGDSGTSSATNPSHSYSSPSTFQVTLVASNAQGCQNFLTKPVQIYSLPVPDFSIGLPPFSCANALTPFQNNTAPLMDSNIISWDWQFNDAAGGSSSLQAPSYTFTTTGDFNVNLTATTDEGCSAVVTKSVTISPSPTADFTQGPACLNKSTAFADLSGGGVQSRLWQIGASSFTTTNPSYTFNASGDFDVTLSVTGANGCSNVKVKTIAVPVPPTLNFTVNNACADQNTKFTDVTSSTADGIVGWNWNFSGNSLTGNPAEFKFNPSGTYNVKMTTTHASGCQYTLSKNVTINPSPVASFIASPDRGNAPLFVQFTNTSQQANTYLWKFYDKVTSTSTESSPTYTFPSLGDYAAELTATNSLGCSDVVTIPILVLIPKIDLVLKDFSLMSDPATGKLKSSVTIINNSNVPVGSAVVALFLSEKAVVNETVSLNLEPGQTASRTLSFTVSRDQFDLTFLCAEVLAEKDVEPDNNKRCINLENAPYFINPYPNPSSGEVHLDWISASAGDTALIIVYDGMGRKNYEWQTETRAGLNQTMHDLSFLAAGLYYVIIETGGIRSTTRFLRQ